MDFSLVPSILKTTFFIQVSCCFIATFNSKFQSLNSIFFAQQFSISKKMYRFLYLYNLLKCLLQYMLYEESD